MAKFLKIVGWLVGLLVLLVVAAVVVLPMVIDPNDYKAEITDKVRQLTGRTLSVDGDLSLSVFPWLGMEIGSLGLSNAEGFGESPFARVKQAAIRVKLMPLLSKRLEVDTIGLDGLELNLARQKDGRTNWDDLTAEQKTADKKEGDGSTGSDVGLAGFSVGGIDINDARVSWDDRAAGQRFDIDGLNLQSGAIEPGRPVDLKLELVAKSSAPQVEAALQLQAQVKLDDAAGLLQVDDLELAVDAKGDALPGGKAQAELQAGLLLTLDGQSLEVRGLALNADGLKLDAELKASHLQSKPLVDGVLKLADIDLRQWLVDHGISLPMMSDDKALTLVGADATLASDGAVTRIEPLTLRLDDTRITGGASLEGEAVGFRLAVDAIDVDRYLPPEQAEAAADAPSVEAPASAGTEQQLLPVETLRALQVDGVLEIGRLTVKRLLAEQIQVSVKAKDGRLEVGQQVKKFYQGTYRGKLNLDVSGKSPLTRIDSKAEGIEIGPLLKDLSDQDRLTGKGRLDAKLNTRGNSIDAFKRSLGGNLSFKFENGAVKGINLARMIREAKARLKGKMLPEDGRELQTDFSEMSGSAAVKQGVVTNKDLLAKSPFLRVDGKGKVNLVAENLDYTIKAVVVSTAKGQGGEGLEELKGIPVPVHLTGDLAAPKFEVDWKEVLVATQKGKLENQKQKLEEKIQDKLQDQLKGLFR